MSQKRSLLEIFQAVTTKKASGSIVIKYGRNKTILYFQEGSLQKFSYGKNLNLELAEYLVKAGKASPQHLQDVIQKTHGNFTIQDLSKHLISDRTASEEELSKAFREKISNDLYGLFLQKDGEYEFKKDVDEAKDSQPLGFSFDLVSFLQELASQMGEWQIIQEQISSTKTIFVRTKKFDEALDLVPLSSRVREESVLIDGQKSVEDIVGSSPLGRLEILYLLAELYKSGGIEPIATEEAFKEFQNSMARQDTQQSLKYLQTLRESNALSLQGRLKLAKSYADLKYKEDAIEEYSRIAYESLETEDPAPGIEACQALLDFRKGNKMIMFQLYKIFQMALQRSSQPVDFLADPKDRIDYKFRVHSLDLAFLLVKEGDMEKGYKILLDLQTRFPKDLEVLLNLAEIAYKKGDLEKAKECYAFLAENATTPEKKKEYNKILCTLDPSQGYDSPDLSASTEISLDALNISLRDLGIPKTPSIPSKNFGQQRIALASGKKSSGNRRYILIIIGLLFFAGLSIVYELKARVELGNLNNKWSTYSEELVKKETHLLSAENLDTEGMKKLKSEYEKISQEYKDFLQKYSWSTVFYKGEQQAQKYRLKVEFFSKSLESLRIKKETEEREIELAFRKMLNDGKNLEEKGEHSRAIAIYFQAVSLFPQFEKKVTLPITLISSPSGAQVFLDGKELGKTPLVQRIPFRKNPLELKIEKKGFWSIEKKNSAEEYVHYNLNLVKNTKWYEDLEIFTTEPLAFSEEKIGFLGKNGKFYSIAPGDGKILGSLDVGSWGDSWSNIAATSQGMFLGNPEGNIFFIPKYGESKIFQSIGEPVLYILPVQDESLVVITRDGYLHMLGKAGEHVAKYELKGAPLSSLLKKDNIIYSGTTGGKIFAFSEEQILKGSEKILLWEEDINIKGMMQNKFSGFQGKNAYYLLLPYWDGLFVAFNTKSKQIQWKQNLEGEVEGTPQVFQSQGSPRIVLMTNEGNLYCLNENGEIIWKKKTSFSSPTALSVGNKNIYFAALSKEKNTYFALSELVALDRNTGEISWNIPILGKIATPPQCWKNQVYLSSSEGYFYAFEED